MIPPPFTPMKSHGEHDVCECGHGVGRHTDTRTDCTKCACERYRFSEARTRVNEAAVAARAHLDRPMIPQPETVQALINDIGRAITGDYDNFPPDETKPGGFVDDVLARCLTLLSSLPQRGWQDIATAPKDGSAKPLLLQVEMDDGALVAGEAYWYRHGDESVNGWWWANTDPGGYHDRRVEPHSVKGWMPLPEPMALPAPEPSPVATEPT